MLPTDDGFNDICTVTGLEWRYILTLLVDVGLIVNRTTSVVNQKNLEVIHCIKKDLNGCIKECFASGSG